MSTYRRAATRVVLLCTLIAGFMVLAEPTPVAAFSCISDCNAAYNLCISRCHSQPDPFGCEDACLADYEDCTSGC